MMILYMHNWITKV